MPKRKIEENVAEEAASLKRKGHSFRAIGKSLNINPRTVKSLVDRMTAGKNAERWEKVDIQLDAQYLGEHFHLLQQVGAGVFEAVQTHAKNTGPKVEPEAWLDHQVGAALAQGGEALLIGRGIAKAPAMDRDIEVPQQVSRILLKGLMEHESGLAEALDGEAGWTKRWLHFQQSRLSMIERARGLFLQSDYEEDHASSMAETAVKTLITRTDEQVESHWVVGEPPLADAPEAADYDRVVNEIRLGEIRRSLQDSSDRVAEAAEQVANAVIEFQLRGRPDGHCFLCPSKSGEEPQQLRADAVSDGDGPITAEGELDAD